MWEDTPELRFDGAGGTLERGIVETRAVEITCAPVDGAVTAGLVIGSDDLGSPVARLGGSEWRWEWHPRGRVGSFTVRLTVERHDAALSTWNYTLVVAPTKLEQEHYRHLLIAIQRTAAGLVYALGGGATGMTSIPDAAGPNSLLADYWTRLRSEVDLAHEITLALTRQHQPASRTIRRDRELAELTELPLAALARAAENGLDELDGAVGPLDRLLPRSSAGKPQVPRSLPVVSTTTTRETYEHRLLLRLIDELRWRCDFVQHELARELAWRTGSSSFVADQELQELKDWRDQARAAGRILERCRNADLLADVTPLVDWKGPSERMRRDPRYRRIGELWRMVHGQPFVALRSPAFDLPVGDLPALYEQWCLLEVARTLSSIGEPAEQQFLEVEEYAGGAGRVAWGIRLHKDRPLLRIRRRGGEELSLYYQRRFRAQEGHGHGFGSLDPFLRVPDIVVELNRPGQQPALLVFDAKYRVVPDGGIPEEALGDAYTYHAALGHAGSQVSRGVFLLYPGSVEFEQGSVGALPLLPGQTASLQAVVDRFLVHPVA